MKGRYTARVAHFCQWLCVCEYTISSKNRFTSLNYLCNANDFWEWKKCIYVCVCACMMYMYKLCSDFILHAKERRKQMPKSNRNSFCIADGIRTAYTVCSVYGTHTNYIHKNPFRSIDIREHRKQNETFAHISPTRKQESKRNK